MAMHFKTIDYNMKHNITKTYDGVNIESASYFPAQSLNYIKVFKNIYTSYGMQYDCPVYNINETDKETTKYGLKTTKDTKKEHIFFSTQHTCFIGLLIHAHARLYYRPLRGKNRMSDLAGKFLKQITSDFKYLLPKE